MAKNDTKKEEKLLAKRDKLTSQIADLRDKIDSTEDEKAKEKLTKKKDALIEKRDALTTKPGSNGAKSINLAPRTAKIIKRVVAIVLVCAIAFAYVATGSVRHGFISYLNIPQNTLNGLVITDANGKKHGIKVGTYNYYFAMVYNNLQSTQETYESYGLDLATYGLDYDFDEKLSKQTTTNDDGDTVTVLEYIKEEVVEGILSTYTYYYAAVAANDGEEPSITEDQETELQETLDEYEETANSYGYTLSGYLKAALGKGVSEKTFRREAKIAYIAENYQEEYEEELLAQTYSDEEYETYYDENQDEIDVVDVKMFECDSEDDAEAFAKALKEDGSNFAKLCSKYSSEDWDVEAYKDDVESTYNAINRSTIQNLGYAIATADETDEDDEDAETTYSGLDWLFSTDRKAGDVKQQSTTVVYVVTPVYKPTMTTVNVRHILIQPEVDDDADITDATEDQWAEALESAQAILDEWKEGDATAETFGELAAENTADSNGDDGGLYTNVYPNEMVSSFDAWCFDSSRQEGDTEIIQTEYGYHIMYFEGYGDLEIWEYTAQQALATEDGTEAIEELEASYTIKTKWFASRYFQIDTDIDS